MLAVYSHTLCKSSSKCPSHFASLWNVCCLYAVSYKALARRGICCLFFEEKILQWVFFLFFFFFLAFLFVCLILIKHTVLIVFHRRLARLVVGPFCAWNCTGGGPSVHCKITNSMKILQPRPGKGRSSSKARKRSCPHTHWLPWDHLLISWQAEHQVWLCVMCMEQGELWLAQMTDLNLDASVWAHSTVQLQCFQSEWSLWFSPVSCFPLKFIKISWTRQIL